METNDLPTRSVSGLVTDVGTRDGAVVGTAPYMSPEQARGEAVDRRTDVWAFGCVLYEMLAGSRAFNGADAAATVSQILEREPGFRGAASPNTTRRSPVAWAVSREEPPQTAGADRRREVSTRRRERGDCERS